VTTSLGISLRLSTVYHPQTDGQTERVNQVLEQYLRVFTSYNQDNWSAILPHASFAYNNSIHTATDLSPFYANFGYHPRWVEEIQDEGEPEYPAGFLIAESLIKLHQQCSANIAEANLSYKKYYDNGRKEPIEFEVGDQVMLSMRNIKTKRPSKKLDIRLSGPYTIIDRIGSHAYRLSIPEDSNIHDVFYVSLLQPFKSSSYPGQPTSPREPIEAVYGKMEYEVSSIVDSRRNKRNKRIEYLVEWLGYEGTDDNTSWEPIENLSNSMESVDEFNKRYPNKADGRRN